MATDFRERLTANANDFDGIVADMLRHIEELERDAGLTWFTSTLMGFERFMDSPEMMVYPTQQLKEMEYILRRAFEAGRRFGHSELTKIGTVLPGDPYDEREGLYMDRKEMKSLHALPVGAVLYAKLP